MLRYSDITPKAVYLSRRRFLAAGGAAAFASSALTARAAKIEGVNTSGRYHDLLGDPSAPKKTVTGYNNFYEFGTGKTEPSRNAPKWTPDPEWPVRLEGEVTRAKTLSLDQILKLAPLEERIYRLRCVEGWSYVVPWIGFPLSTLLNQLERKGNAKFVAFQSYYDPKVMLSPRQAGIQFPYVEGLRLDEALHPLTLLVVGMYGETLPNQNGAPVRVVIPWKYGFKSIKSITHIRFMERQPATTWNLSWPAAYGFYSNVNPKREHPGWSQENEDRLDGSGFLGQGRKIDTALFNGYTEVAGMYSGMDLIKNY